VPTECHKVRVRPQNIKPTLIQSITILELYQDRYAQTIDWIKVSRCKVFFHIIYVLSEEVHQTILNNELHVGLVYFEILFICVNDILECFYT
jgi:hypothetical protein